MWLGSHCGCQEPRTGVGRGSATTCRRTTETSMPIVCTNCLRRFLATTPCASSSDATHLRDCTYKALCNYLDGRASGNSRRSSSDCSSTTCIWSELEQHLSKQPSIVRKRILASPGHGNGESFEQSLKALERIFLQFETQLTRVRTTWNSRKRSSLHGSSSTKRLRFTETCESSDDAGKPRSSSTGVTPGQASLDPFTTLAGEMLAFGEPIVPTPKQEPTGSTTIEANQLSCLTTSWDGSPCTDGWSSPTGTTARCLSKEASSPGAPRRSTSRATRTTVPGGTSAASPLANSSFELSSDESQDWFISSWEEMELLEKEIQNLE